MFNLRKAVIITIIHSATGNQNPIATGSGAISGYGAVTPPEIIRIDTSKPYDVVIGSGILSGCGKAAAKLPKNYDRAVIISDDTVHGLYGDTVRQSFESADFSVSEFVFPHGEASKSLATLTDAASFLSESYVTRKSLIVALGGGVTGDLSGFLAAIFQRGIDYMQIPTTFLAAIDSSVGGKTAVNIPAAKNMLGAFWQPELVWCDVDTLSTLSADIFKDGIAEAVKYGCILDDSLFALMRDSGFSDKLSEIIARCVELKAEVVRQDERDNGLRAILNFGHTLGHGIEKLSSFEISHGKAVAMGMILAADAGENAGLTETGTSNQIKDILLSNGISVECPYPAADVCAASLGDKKRDGNSISIILLEKIGKAFVHPVSVDSLTDFFGGGN